MGIAALAVAAIAGIGANVALGSATQALAKEGQEKTAKAVCSLDGKAKRFENAEAAKVFAWLRENGVRLAIEDEHIYTGALLTLALDTGKPATAVAKLASALHLQPTKRGEYYALVRGIGSESASETLGGEDFARGYDQENPWRAWIEQQRKGEDGDQRWRIYSDDEEIDIEVLMQEFEGFDFDFEFDFDFDVDDFMQEHGDFDFDFDFEDFMEEHGGFDFDFDFDFDEMFDSEFMSEWESADGTFGFLQSSDQVAKRLQEANEKMKNKLSKEQIAELAEILSEMPHLMVVPQMGRLGRGLELGELRELMGERGELLKRLELGAGERSELLKRLKEGGGARGIILGRDGQMLELKHLEEMQGDVSKAMAEAMKHLKLHLGERGEMSKEIERAMKAHVEALKNLYGEEGAMKLDVERAMKAREEAMKELKRHFGEGGDFSKRMEKMQAELKEKMAGVAIKLENLKEFMKSLTPEQRKLAKEQGYLKLSDLTKEQRKLLGGFDDRDELHMKFRIDDETIVIKGDGK